ncbi:MAG: hypothetical protein Q9207_000645 [Kuettlingeria erythrocarpa]
MPRVTRAALQAAAAVPLPATPPVTKRAPLGEISGNQEGLPVAVEDPEHILKGKKGPARGKKGKVAKRNKKHEEAANDDEYAGVLPDENESQTSSAVDDACQDLLTEQPQDISQIQIILHDTSPHNPPSPAVTAATENLTVTPSPHNPILSAEFEQANLGQHVDESPAISDSTKQDAHRPEKSEQMPSQSDRDTPAALNEEIGASARKVKGSPKKVALRPEDSIEAIDKFEDEIERVGDLIPAIDASASTSKTLQKRDKTAKIDKVKTVSKGPESADARKDPMSRPTVAGPNPKVAALEKKRAAIHPSALKKTQTVQADPTPRQVSDSSASSDKASTKIRKRVSSIHRAPFVPTKSTKAPTRSNFELPGEAVARKLKEAREERAKREEGEDKAAKPAFKARPVRLSQAPVVKATAASRARISMAKGETPAAVAMNDVSPKFRVTPRPSTVSAAGKRLSTLPANKRSTPGLARTSARVTPGPASSTVRQSVNATEAAQLKAKGKEVFNRGQIEHDEREKMRKDKEEAARKARAEAAERGRIASRQWAEKQKAKKMAEKKTKDGTVATSEASLQA